MYGGLQHDGNAQIALRSLAESRHALEEAGNEDGLRELVAALEAQHTAAVEALKRAAERAVAVPLGTCPNCHSGRLFIRGPSLAGQHARDPERRSCTRCGHVWHTDRQEDR